MLSCPECVEKYVNYCVWYGWINQNSGLESEQEGDEVELLEDAKHIPGFPDDCAFPKDVECRTADTHIFSNETDDDVTCDKSTGLLCRNHPNMPRCADYEVRYLCCGRHYTVTCSTPTTATQQRQQQQEQHLKQQQKRPQLQQREQQQVQQREQQQVQHLKQQQKRPQLQQREQQQVQQRERLQVRSSAHNKKKRCTSNKTLFKGI